MDILRAVLTLGIMGGIFALLLGIASQIFKVEINPKEKEVLEALPGINCGACGYVGCEACAKAIVNGEAHITACKVGGQEVSDNIAKIMGVNSEISIKEVSFVACNGGCNAKDRYEFAGTKDCRVTSETLGGVKECRFACQGGGNCVDVCEYDAIHIINGVAVVDPDKCTACAKCIKACPKNLISLRLYNDYAGVACSNKDFGKAVSSVCTKGCIGCGLCAKLAPKSFELNGKLAFYKNSENADIEKIKMAAEKCPTGAILLNNEKINA